MDTLYRHLYEVSESMFHINKSIDWRRADPKALQEAQATERAFKVAHWYWEKAEQRRKQ